jgi:hypothetical protein
LRNPGISASRATSDLALAEPRHLGVPGNLVHELADLREDISLGDADRELLLPLVKVLDGN